MDRLRQRDKDRRYPHLVVGEVLHDVSVEAEYAELVRAHDSRKKLHHEDFVVKRETFVVTIEIIVELLAKCLRIVEKLYGREIRGRCISLLLLFLCVAMLDRESQYLLRATYRLDGLHRLSDLLVPAPGLLVDLSSMLQPLDVRLLPRA